MPRRFAQLVDDAGHATVATEFGEWHVVWRFVRVRSAPSAVWLNVRNTDFLMLRYWPIKSRVALR